MSIHEPPAASTEPPLECGVSHYRFSIDQYHQMIASGILTEDDRVQLLEGEIVCMTPIGPLHRYAVVVAGEALSRLVPPEWKVITQQPITLAGSEPEPDLSVVRSEAALALDRHPGAADTALIIEVADSSLPLDRNRKQAIYAAAGIPEYWIVNLAQRSIEVYREPAPAAAGGRAAYSVRHEFRDADAVPVCIAGQEIGKISVAEIIPKA
ncbi:MAG TPA: Uma2 family endonuclease [Pirellulales bacterium]|nr:Uma2 family endonuclease [Pirellulales bacterium]